MVALLMEIPHSDLPKVTWMVFVQVRSVVVLSTSKTSSTGMLAVLSYTTVTGRDVTAATIKISAYILKAQSQFPSFRPLWNPRQPHQRPSTTTSKSVEG
jgi:hypothetical protein